MALVALTPAKVNERARSEVWSWSVGTPYQNLIGNELRWVIATAWRPIRGLWVHMKGTDTATPGGSGVFQARLRFGSATYEFPLGRYMTPQVAGVGPAACTYAWLRGTCSPNILADSGCLIYVQASSEGLSIQDQYANGPLGMATELVLNLDCSLLTGVAVLYRMDCGIYFAD